MKISFRGKHVFVPCIKVNNCEIISRGIFPRIATVFDDFLNPNYIKDPKPYIHAINNKRMADIFSFLGKIDDSDSKSYNIFTDENNVHIEHDFLAAIRIKTYDDWLRCDIKKQTRKRIKKSKKIGISVKRVDLDSNLIEDITKIFNETPVRQGRKFWHYGKDFEQSQKGYFDLL